MPVEGKLVEFLGIQKERLLDALTQPGVFPVMSNANTGTLQDTRGAAVSAGGAVPLSNFGQPIGIDYTAVLATAFAARANIQWPEGVVGLRPGVLNIDYTALIQGFGAVTQIVPLAGGTVGAPIFNIARTASTPASDVNIFGQLIGPVLQNFQIRDSRTIDCVGFKIGAVDEIKAYGVTCYGLIGGAWLYDPLKAVRECEFYSCYDWFCGDSTRPSTSIVSMNTTVAPTYGCVDQHNGLYYYGCKTVYPYGNGLLLDSLDATATAATRLAVWTNCHWEGQYYTITGTSGHTQGDLVWARQSGYGIQFINCQNGNPDGYVAGVSSGWANYRVGDKANNRTAQHVTISGGQIGNWVAPSTGGPGVVDEQCLYLSVTSGTEFIQPFPNNYGLCLGGLPHNSTTLTANSLNQLVAVDPSVMYLDAAIVADPGGEMVRLFFGRSSYNWNVPNSLAVGNLITQKGFVVPFQAATGFQPSFSSTPDVTNTTQFICQPTSATTITNFLNGTIGQKLTILFANGNTTIAHNSTINLLSHTNFTPAGATTMLLEKMNGGTWYEMSRTVI